MKRAVTSEEIETAEAIGDYLSRRTTAASSSSVAGQNQQPPATFLSSVYRRVLANLLLEPSNPKFRSLKESNATIKTCLVSLGEVSLNQRGSTDQSEKGNHVDSRQQKSLHVGLTLFSWIGFRRVDESVPIGEGLLAVPDDEAGVRANDRSRLMHADALLTLVEKRIAANHAGGTDVDAPGRRRREAERERQQHLEQLQREQLLDATIRERAGEVRQTSGDELAQQQQQQLFMQADFDAAAELTELSRRTIHFTGRLRNYSFEAKHYAVRRMEHGRVFACAGPTTDACPNSFLEAHWHVINGNILYGYVAHLSEAGDKVMHIGPEYGYQYNTIPGTANFGKTVLFSVKVIDPQSGVVVKLEHPNRPADTCIFCGKPFSVLFL